MVTMFVLKGLLSFFPPTAELVHQSRACRDADGALHLSRRCLKGET